MSCCNNDAVTRNELILLVNKSREAAACAEANCASSFTNATNAATSATNAANSATAAAASETNVENIWEDFQERYMGPYATPPVAPGEGSLYYNTTSNVLFVWNGSAWASADFNEFTNFTATGTTTARNLVTRFADVVNVLDFGADPTGVVDSTDEIKNFLNYCRTNKKKGFIPSGTYLISSDLDISGVDIEGVLKGYRNQDGTIIKGSGGHVILNQNQVNSNNITYSIKNIRIENGSVGIRMTYSVNCIIENIFIVNCVDGIYCGVSGILGPLWNNFKNCQVDVSNIALSINGNNFSNANIFDTCFFEGDVSAITIDCNGGIGAVSNQFINTEIKGNGIGATLLRSKSTNFDNCYFESIAPAIVAESFSVDTIIDGCVFGSLKNTNPISPSFIYHKTGSCNITVNGGYIYLNSGSDYNNLYFISSDIPNSLSFEMVNSPQQEIYSTGFNFFGSNLPTTNDRLIYSSSYTPIWTTTGTAPSIGDGSLSGRYTLNGRSCTVQFELLAGNTTNFGTGDFRISLPFNSVSSGQRAQGIARIFDSGTGQYTSLIEVNSGSSLMVFYPTNSITSIVSGTSPMTWQLGDALRGTITYQIS